VPLVSRLSAAFVSLVYLTVVAIPCVTSVSSAAAATPRAGRAPAHSAPPAHAPAAAPGPAQHGVPQADHAGHTGHEGHAEATRAPDRDAPARHEHASGVESVAQLSPPCLCGCSDSADPGGSSSARIGFALARAGWARTLELAPVRHAATPSRPPQPPQLASDPVPG